MWDRTTRYGELASQLHEEICSGAFRPGDKLPSIRALCSRFKGSSATITHALYLLEDAGLIAARPRSGFYVRERQASIGQPQQPRPEAVAQPALPAQRALLRELDRLEVHEQPMLFAVIDPDLYPVLALQRIMTAQARRNPSFFTLGDMCAQSPLAGQLARRGRLMGCNWRAEDVTVTPGGKFTHRALLRVLTKPGDTVAIASPASMRLLRDLDAMGLKALEIPAHPEHGLSTDTLDFVLKRESVAACVFSANFSHPTGGLMSDNAKRRTVGLLAKHGVPLIEDDQNGELYFGKSRPLPFKAFDQAGLVHYITNLSDLISPGMSIGFAVTDLRKELDFFPEPAPLFQHTLAAFMASGLFEPHLRRLRQTLAGYAKVHRAAVQRHFPSEACSHEVSGGHWLWVELPRGFDTVALLHKALALGIAFAPGQLFCTDGSLNHCLRLNMGMPLTDRTERDIAALGQLISEELVQLRTASV